ncbi:MAG: hypothetical protein E7473_08065 [Ruminococcaceae bacterium]|nr:hypothetical protein [Oscillospiraceae bacterium]
MKKYLALFLACILIIGFIPTTFAAESDLINDEGNFWLFTSGSHGVTGQLTAVSKDSTGKYNYISNVTLDGTVESVSDRWALANQWYSSSYHPFDGCFKWTPSSKSVATFTSAMNGLLFELETDTAGTFNPELTYVAGPHSAIYEIYLIEKGNLNWGMYPDGSVNLSNDRVGVYNYASANPQLRLGVLDAYNATDEVKTKVFREVTVKANTSYYLLFAMNGSNSAYTPNFEGKPEARFVSLSLSERKEKAERSILTYKFNTNSFDANTIKFMAQGSLDGQFYNQQYISWKNITKKYDATVGGLVDCESYSPMYLDKTSPFSIENKITPTTGASNYPRIDSTGITSTIMTSSYSNAAQSRAHLAVRVNIPSAGQYELTTYDKLTDKGYTVNTTSTDYGVVMKVYFGSAPDVYVASKILGLIESYENIGWYDTRTLSEKDQYIPLTPCDGESAPKVINVPAAGEYYILFMTDPESLEKNPTMKDNWQFLSLSSIKLTPVDNTEFDSAKEEISEIVNVDAGNAEDVATTIENAEVKAVAADIKGSSIADNAIIPSEVVAVGSNYTASAPSIPGYEFLCWAKDLGKNRKIVSHEKDYTFKVTSGGTLLMAVYRNTDATDNVAMFYNGNGQLLATQTGTYSVPALPSMAGFGGATHWALHGSTEEFAPGATGTISGEMRFVAQYGELQDVTVTVTNGTGGGTVTFGSDVTVTATERSGTQFFNYWVNENGEILSFDKSYTFKALKNCTVTAVYNEFIPVAQNIRKIIITNSGNDVFAEFIGIDNVIERGILFGENANLGSYTAKVPMTTDAEHFTVNNDLEGEPDATGYAILDGGKVIYSK